MAEPEPAIVGNPFDPLPPPSPLLFSPSDDIDAAYPLPSAFSPDLCFADDLDLDLDLDFSVDDFFRPSDAPDPPSDPASGDGSGVSSSSPPRSSPPSPVSGHSGTNLPEKSEIEGERRGGWGLKRKSGKDDDKEGLLDCYARGNSKYRRSEEANASATSSTCVFSAGNDDEEKRKARLMRNRESAHLSRQRKKHYVGELEEKVKAMHSTINELNSKISYFMAENLSLRQQLGGGGGAVYAQPPPGAIAHMPFPWIPGYALRPPGSQVGLVPIPKLKTQQSMVSAPKSKKSEKNGEKKTKKVASVSLLGLLLIMMFCGVLVPGVNFRFGETSKVLGFANNAGIGSMKGRVLSVDGRGYGSNSSDEVGLCSGKSSTLNGKSCQNGKLGPQVKHKGTGPWPRHASEAYVPRENSSETLPALLYVPRNGKRVKINGNLIIHSVLAGEKALAQEKAKQSSGKEGKETGLTLAGNLVPALAVTNAGREVDRQSSSDKYAKTTPVDAPLQKWFREGMAGPILSSGMCTEVFQFDASPSSDHSSAVFHAASTLNATSTVNTSDYTPNSKNRRMKFADPIPLNGTTLNDTSQFRSTSESHFDEKKPVSSMVVSVLADPREAGNGDGEGRVSPNSISRIFVVVLMDSVKYVTYSCVLPFKSSAPHLVN